MSKNDTLLEAAKQLRLLTTKVAELRNELDNYRKRDEAEKIAQDLSKKGLLPADQISEKAREWIDNGKDLNVIEEAVKLAEAMPNPTWDTSAPALNNNHFSDPDSRIVSFIMQHGN